MNRLDNNIVHVKKILNNISKENFQLIRIFHNGLYSGHSGRAFSNGVMVVKNNKLAGRLEDIKFLESLEPESRKQFLREGKILSAMHHKNIPKVYDILEYEDLLLFRYEHIDGYSLKEVLDYLKKKKMVLPQYVATSIISKIMSALFYAHNEVRYDGKKRSIIHCDIKPSNIILCAKGYNRKGNLDEKFITLLKQNKAEPFLIDFGIAKFRGKADADGTTNYLSPAQISNGKLDWRTDVYQLLLVYYELLTLKVPYSNLSRTRILEEKLKHDFVLDKKSDVNGLIKDFIEKGTKRDASDSFKSERSCMNALSRIESSQKRFEFFRKYKKPIITIVIFVFCLALLVLAYKVWDYQTQSTDAIIRSIEHNSNSTLEELETATAKIQTRAFEKKYYEPLLKGEFRDAKTGKPLYPSHLDSNGNWILVGPETEDAGAFAGLLFDYSDRYPKLLDYAKEYAEPILDSDFDGSGEKRFMYALIPGYEKTEDERYLRKLINVSDTLMYHYSFAVGSTQCVDIYQEKLFLYVYNMTGDKKYLDFYNNLTKAFVKNNIDDDGYIYLSVSVEELPNGSTYYDKWSKLAVPVGTTPIGNYFELSNISEPKFKNITSLFSRDFVEVLLTLQDMYTITNDKDYIIALNKANNYYTTMMPLDETDDLFISAFNEENNIPKDTLATVKALYVYKDRNTELYIYKLKALLSKYYFRNENEKGILSGSVFIENMRYDNSDSSLRNQSIIETDSLFLELKIKNKNFKVLTA